MKKFSIKHAETGETIVRCGICCPSRIGMPPDTEGCIMPDGHDSQHEYIAGGSRVTWETDMECDCDDCMGSDSFADNCLVYDIAPNVQVSGTGPLTYK